MQGLAGLKIVGADIVEVAPGYDTQGQEFPSQSCTLIDRKLQMR